MKWALVGLASVAALFAVNGSTKTIEGTVVSIADGDTLTVLDDAKTQHKIRLEGIDAPESYQPFGTKSSKALGDKVFQKRVRVEWSEHDKYGRILGNVYVDDRLINKEMVQEGWAWHYRQYSSDEDLAAAETKARDGKAGLWADAHPIAPWDFRHGKTGDANIGEDTTVYVTKSGTKYHRAGCRYLSKSKIPISLKDAKAKYGACSVCKPPK